MVKLLTVCVAGANSSLSSSFVFQRTGPRSETAADSQVLSTSTRRSVLWIASVVRADSSLYARYLGLVSGGYFEVELERHGGPSHPQTWS